MGKRAGQAALGLGLLIGLALLWAAPAAAAGPTRTVIPSTDPIEHYSAGSGCTFNVTTYLSPGARTTVTNFSDGRSVYEAHSMHRTIMSDVTGKAYVENLQFRDVEQVDASGVIHGVTTGQQIQQFYPGDVGPFGLVDQTVAYQINGIANWSYDPATGHQPAFSYMGTIIDICAAIS